MSDIDEQAEELSELSPAIGGRQVGLSQSYRLGLGLYLSTIVLPCTWRHAIARR